jgi:hypothetical protein
VTAGCSPRLSRDWERARSLASLKRRVRGQSKTLEHGHPFGCQVPILGAVGRQVLPSAELLDDQRHGPLWQPEMSVPLSLHVPAAFDTRRRSSLAAIQAAWSTCHMAFRPIGLTAAVATAVRRYASRRFLKSDEPNGRGFLLRPSRYPRGPCGMLLRRLWDLATRPLPTRQANQPVMRVIPWDPATHTNSLC